MEVSSFFFPLNLLTRKVSTFVASKLMQELIVCEICQRMLLDMDQSLRRSLWMWSTLKTHLMGESP